MKILHVTPTYIPAYRYGGPIFSVHRLCREQARLGNEVYVFTSACDGETDLDVPIESIVKIDGVNVRYFKVVLFRWLYIMPKMLIHIRRGKFDIVHVHSVFNLSSTLSMIVCRLNKIPYVLSPRGMLDQRLIQLKKTIIKTIWIKYIDSKNYRSANLLHFTSELEERKYSEVVPCRTKSCVVPNGIEVPDLPNYEKTKNILYLGRLNWKKNILVIVESLLYVEEYHLDLVGPDEEGLWEVISNKAKEIGVENRVHYIGEKHGVKKNNIISSSFCLLLVSESENFGNVVLEAMALGTVVVVSEGVGIAKTIRERFSGIVVSPNALEISAAIKRLEDKNLYRTIVKNGRNTVCDEYEITKVSIRMISEYNAAIVSSQITEDKSKKVGSY